MSLGAGNFDTKPQLEGKASGDGSGTVVIGGISTTELEPALS